MFIWGNKIINEDKSKKEILFEFLFELLLECLTQFKLKYEPKIMIGSKEISHNIEKNYYFKNYLYFINQIYIFSFRYRLDSEIHIKGISHLYSSSPKIEIPEALIQSMRIIEPMSNKIEKSWLDFPLINDVIYRIKSIWGKKNLYKNLNVDK